MFFELGYARGVLTKDWKYITVRYTKDIQDKINTGIEFSGWKGRKNAFPYYTRNGHLGHHASKDNPLYFHSDQLFNLKEDPSESFNIFENEPNKSDTMKKLLIQSLKTFVNRPYGEFN
ncbi:hypothetical protein [Jejuia pallidilutea]|uniref:hypothetical protein n=1 Tax=Jejuia pallidilutea TaxID=504487 RepID=UPI0005AB19BD|nr:hypothetical protein [Jejuia pallidilutea]